MFRLSSPVRSLGFSLFSFFLSSFVVLFFLAGCSGDDVQVELTGQVDRTLSAGMKACLDTSGNGKCDADEPSGRTNADGTYSVIIPAESLGQFPLVVEPTKKEKTADITLSAPAGKHDFVSPISTAVQSRVYLGSTLAEAEADVRARYALPENIDLYTDYQGGSLEPEPVHALLEAVASDYGFDVAGSEEPAEVVADAQRIGVRRVGRASAASSLDNGVAEDVAESPSFVAATAERSISAGSSRTNGENTLSSSADSSDKDSQSDGSHEEDIDKNDSSSKVSGSDDPGDNTGKSNGSGTGGPGGNSGNSNGSSTGDPGNNSGNSDPSDNFMSISAIQLDVLKIEACADEGGCTVASGPMQLDLLELPDGKVDLPNQVLLPENTKELRFVLGDNNSIVVDDESFPLTVPSGQTSGLKLKGQKAFGVESGFLSDLTLNLNLSKQLVVQGKESKSKVKGKGKKGSSDDAVVSSYKLKPVIKVLEAAVTQPIFEEEKIPYLAMVVAQGMDKVKLAWVSGSDGKTAAQQVQYEIHLSVDENFIPDSSTLKKTVIGKTYTKLSELNENTIYYCKIIAHYSTYSSEPSNELQTKTYKNPVQQDLSVIAVKASDLGLGKHSTTDGITYIYSGGTPPEVGSVLFSEDITGGMTLRTVDSVSTSGNTVIVKTSDASLTDTLDVGSIYTSFKLIDIAAQTESLLATSKASASAMSFASAEEGRLSHMEWSNKLLIADQVNYAHNEKDFSVTPQGTSSVLRLDAAAVENSFTTEIDVDFEPELITEAEWGGVIIKELDYAKVAAKGTLSLTARAEYEFSVAGSVEKEFRLFKRTWRSLYSAGPVPVYQEITLSVEVEASASASAEVNAMAQAQLIESLEVGAEYNGSTWTPYITYDESESLTASLDIVGQASGEIRLIPEIEVEFYEVLEAELTVEPFVGSDLTASKTTNNLDFLAAHPERLVQLRSFDASLGMESNISVEFDVLGKSWDILPTTCILGTGSCLYTFNELDLFSIPTMELRDNGSVLTLEVTDGVHNPFNLGSVVWEIFPDDAVLTPNSCNRSGQTTVCTATFLPGTAGEYAIFASGYGILGEVARQFNELAPQISSSTCPSGNGLYCGSIDSSLDDNTLYNCQDGNYQVEEQCSNGCEVMPPDENDRCSSGGPITCPYGTGYYCGSSSLGQNSNSLYYCQNGNYEEREQCTNGCEIMDPYVDDECKDAPTSCPYGTGYYCGESSLSQNSNSLYYCQDGNYEERQQCTNGCEVMPPYVSDKCKSASCPSGDGLYCGTIDSSLSNNTLYYCQDGNYQVREQCSSGCKTMPSGYNDQCY